MIDPLWKRIAGLHMQDEGEIGVVWLAHDKETDCVHLYDACMFRKEVLPVICEGLNARGRWIPIAWQDKAISTKLSERGSRMLHDPEDDMVEMTSRDIQERMRSGRFKVDKRLGEWLEEFRTYYQENAQIPKGFPLMTATRFAVANLKRARRQSAKKRNVKNYPRVAIL
jgi:hypothetical protein